MIDIHRCFEIDIGSLKHRTLMSPNLYVENPMSHPKKARPHGQHQNIDVFISIFIGHQCLLNDVDIDVSLTSLIHNSH